MNTEVTDLLNLIDDSMLGGGDNYTKTTGRTTPSNAVRTSNRAKGGRLGTNFS